MGTGGGNDSRIPQCLLGLAVLLWVASLLLPAVDVRGGSTFDGYDVLIQGWSAWRYGVLAWLANPLLMASVVLGWRKRYRPCTVSAALGVVFAVTSLWSADIARAAGMAVPELSFRPGFYCWMAAHLAAAGGGITALALRDCGART